MNIGFDAKRIFYNETGLGNYGRTLVRLLKNNYPADEYVLFSPPVKGQKPTQHKREFADCHIVEPKNFIDQVLSSRWRSSAIVKDLLKYDLDLYHGLSHEIPKNIEKTGIKSIVTIHDLIFLKFPKLYNPWDVTTYKRKYLDSCYRADAVIAISQNTKNDILEFVNIPSEKIHVIYQSAASDYYQPVSESGIEIVKQKYGLSDSYLLYVGSLNKRKNLAPLIKSIALLKNKKLDLVIVGSGSEKRNLEKSVVEAGVSSQVKFLTGVGGEDLKALYTGARVFIYPSLYEGFGIPIIESLLCKTPVVTNLGSCFHEAAGEGGVYVDVTSPVRLAEAIEFLLDESNRNKVAEKGFNHVQNFSPQNFVKNTYDLYKKITK
jgi:glycosyltransferase involved in cell wall biosynthesis